MSRPSHEDYAVMCSLAERGFSDDNSVKIYLDVWTLSDRDDIIKSIAALHRIVESQGKAIAELKKHIRT